MREVERERKYEIERGRPVPGLGSGFSLGPRRRVQLTAVYLDTVDLRLAEARVTLRRRTGGDDAGWHLKLPASGEDRIEVHAPLDEGPAPSRVPPRLQAEVGDLVGGEPLVPVAVMRTTRTEREITTTRGRAVGQLTDDTVRVASWRARGGDPVDEQVWRELEVELADGSADNRESLEQITAELAEAGVPVATAASKVGRFLADRRQQGIDREDTAAEPVLAYVRAQLAQIQSREGDVADDAPDAVHKSRVAARRMRSALRTGRRIFDADVTEPLRDELRWWGQVLGGPRDAEVFRELMEQSLDELPDEQVVGPVRRRMRTEIDRVHAQAHAAAVRSLASQRYTDLMTALVGLVVEPPLRKRGLRPAAEVLPRLVRKAVRRVDDRGHRADTAPHHERHHWLHETRKKAKAARYLGESLVPVFGRRAAELADRFEDVTDSLGEHQDAVVAIERLERMRDRAARAGEPTETYDELIRRQHAARGVTEAAGEEARQEAAKPRVRAWFDR